VIGLGAATKVHLLAGATDMRRGFDGLHALARGLLEADPLSGHVFGFCNKGRNRLKLLYWDGSGLWVCAKRLDKGRFAWPQLTSSHASADGDGASTHAAPTAPLRVIMSQTELTMLLSGIDLMTTRRRAWHRLESSAAR
jgi:transposase